MSKVLSRRKQVLPCVLTEVEVLERRESLVRATKERELREDSLKVWKSAKSDEQKAYEADISHVARDCFRLAGIIDSGREPRDVECEEILGEGPDVSVTTYRCDTGEAVSQRVATQGELQARLDLGEMS